MQTLFDLMKNQSKKTKTKMKKNIENENDE